MFFIGNNRLNLSILSFKQTPNFMRIRKGLKSYNSIVLLNNLGLLFDQVDHHMIYLVDCFKGHEFLGADSLFLGVELNFDNFFGKILILCRLTDKFVTVLETAFGSNFFQFCLHHRILPWSCNIA